MRILHTGDWHLGKVLRGRNRLDEQEAVLAEIVELTAAEQVDLVVVAGDLFESAAPPPEAQRLGWATLLALRATGAEVIVVSGNHDNAPVFEAVRPVFEQAGVIIRGTMARPDAGGVIDLTIGDERARVAVLPWLSPRQIIRAAMLLERDAAELGQVYSERVQRLLGVLTEHLADPSGGPAAVQLVVAHAFVRGGRLGGGEREAQTINDYGLSATAFPTSASYVALGHLHRHQQIPGPCPIWYSGSPIAVDFGEEADRKGVLLVEVEAGKPAVVEHRPLESARRLRTVQGTLRELEDRASSFGDDLLRVIVTEGGRAGLADAVRAVLPNALEVRVQSVVGVSSGSGSDRRLQTPQASFAAYLQEQAIEDPRLLELFSELLASDDEREPAG